MDIGILFGLMSATGFFDVGGFLGNRAKRSILWALFPFFGAIIAWETYIQLGADGQITSGGTAIGSPNIMALLVGFLIIASFLIVFLIGVRRR